MSIADRKKRAWEERNELIISEANTLFEQHGYLGFNLDELAEKIEYSKATIYNHFQTKEDLMVALAVEHAKLRVEFFQRAAGYVGSTRSRMNAVGVADAAIAIRYPHGFSLAQLVSTQSIWEKASSARQMAYEKAGEAFMNIAHTIVKDARACGDLLETAPSDMHILFGLISMSKGSYLMEDGQQVFLKSFKLRPLDVLMENYHLFLDGVGWKPLKHDYDVEDDLKKIKHTLFSNEFSL